MRFSSIKTSVLAFSFVALASVIGSIFTACSSQQAENKVISNTSDASTPQMNHDGMMNHSMVMDLGVADTNYDLRYIDAMTLHHLGGVEMAKEALQKSQHPEIKRLAEDIIRTQNKEIAEMKQWRQAWYPQAENKPMAYDAKTGQMMEMPSDQMKNMMMSMDLGSTDANFDLRFLNAMILHHEGAIAMAKDALKNSKRPRIKEVSQDISRSQQVEVQQMKQWRKAWYNQ